MENKLEKGVINDGISAVHFLKLINVKLQISSCQAVYSEETH